MFERFTKPAREVAVLAQGHARRLGHDHIGTEHVLLGLVTEPDGIAGRVLRGFGVTPTAVEAELDRTLGRGGLSEADAAALRGLGIDLDEIQRRTEDAFGPGALRPPTRVRRGHIPFSRGAKEVLERALKEALGLRHRYIGTEHVLLGLVQEQRDLGLPALEALGVTPEAVRERVLSELREAS